MSVYL
jgi:dTMP kinase